MIARLAGRILEKEPHQVIVDAHGVGYRVFIPLSTFYALPDAGCDVALRIHTHVREDALALYGFCTPDEQMLFERLIEISGIGPRLALAILSGLPAPDLMSAIADGDAGRLRAIPGVGPKTADRVVLELKDRLRLIQAAAGTPARAGAAGIGSVQRDVVSALVNLGYREGLAESAVRKASQGSAPGGIEDVLRRSLKYLGGTETISAER